MPCEENMLLEFTRHLKSIKAPFLIYVDLECLIKKIKGSKNNSEKWFTTKISEHTLCGYSMSTICEFDDKKNKHDVVHRG